MRDDDGRFDLVTVLAARAAPARADDVARGEQFAF
jgi:hypothetical protein